ARSKDRRSHSLDAPAGHLALAWPGRAVEAQGLDRRARGSGDDAEAIGGSRLERGVTLRDILVAFAADLRSWPMPSTRGFEPLQASGVDESWAVVFIHS